MDEGDGTTLRRSTEGDPGAFVELFWRHDGAVHSYLARRAGREVADDLVTEVWLRAFKGRATFDQAQTNGRPWLYGIARNVLRAHWRATSRPIPPLPTVIADPWPEIDDQVDAAARRDELVVALRSLTDDERETLLFVAWERLTPAEIATVLDLPQSTVRNRLHRARAAMRGQLADAHDPFDQEV